MSKMLTANSKTLIVLAFIIGAYLSYVGYVSATWLGYVWVEAKPEHPWWMNTYISVPAKIAFHIYGIISQWLGGLLTGAIVAMLYYNKHHKLAIILIFFAIYFSALGFNTLDWMLSRASGSNVDWSLWVFGLPNIKLNSWDFYFYTVILPLFVGGFLIGLALISLV
ncbi:MAG: hypothetical protein QW734_02095 [Candidatus Bathyarchaeia archaeon]